MANKKGVEVRCPKCKHKFFTTSKMILVSCGSCGRKFNKEENMIAPKEQRKL